MRLLGATCEGRWAAPRVLSVRTAVLTCTRRVWCDRPQTDGPLNYAQMLEYLANKRVLRLLIYDDGKTAIGANASHVAHSTPARQSANRLFRCSTPV